MPIKWLSKYWTSLKMDYGEVKVVGYRVEKTGKGKWKWKGERDEWVMTDPKNWTGCWKKKVCWRDKRKARGRYTEDRVNIYIYAPDRRRTRAGVNMAGEGKIAVCLDDGVGHSEWGHWPGIGEGAQMSCATNQGAATMERMGIGKEPSGVE